MNLRLFHIITLFLLATFVTKEVAANTSLAQAVNKEICKDCDSKSTENNVEEKSLEQEPKLLACTVQLPLPVSSKAFLTNIYKGAYFPDTALRVILQPPKVG